MGKLNSSLVSGNLTISAFIDKKKIDQLLTQDNNSGDKDIAVEESQKKNELFDPTPLNRIRRINKYLEDININLEIGDDLIIKFEPQSIRKQKIINRPPKLIGVIRYYLFDFFFHRVCARLKFTKWMYFLITKGENRSISLTEGLGRLISCGFDIVDFKKQGEEIYVNVRKLREPLYSKNVSYGAIVKLSRVGYNGEELEIYKLRTMRPYSEFLQKFTYEMNGTLDGDKIIDDYRVAAWGVYLRKFWLDELPMLWNFLKGDLKIVGIRPLSRHKFEIYPKYLQELRIRSKPGLIPPYYADLPKSQKEFFNTEKRYLEAYFKSPIKTDITYFFRAIKNIFLKGIRSK